jgi:hypothetical protein
MMITELLLCNMESQHEDLPYHTDIFWLSYQRVLKRCYGLRNEVIMALEVKVKGQDVAEIESIKRVQDKTFSVDITRNLPP